MFHLDYVDRTQEQMPPRVKIGTSGWQYRHWKRTFYPEDLPQKNWLDYYAERFQAVEVNNSFYKLPESSAFQSWADSTPDEFQFALKLSRYLSHVKRLKDPEEPVQRFMDHCEPLGKKLGPLLLQLPPNMKPEPERLERVLGMFPRGVRVAAEFRNDDWFNDEILTLLEKHDAAMCLADEDSRPVTPLQKTATWGYVRLHAGSASPAPCYGRTALDSWVKRIGDLWPGNQDVYVFFNNDTNCCAVQNAYEFALACNRHGMESTSTPDAREVAVAN